MYFPPAAVEYCSHNGVEYEVGHTFDNNCEQRCTCMENGQFNCTDLCEEQEFPDPQDRVGCEIVRGEGEDCCRLQLVCEHGKIIITHHKCVAR